MESQRLKRSRSRDGGTSSSGFCSSEDEAEPVVPPEDRTCGFCNRGHREGLEAATDFIDIPTDTNVWATDKPTLKYSKNPVWCHTNCVHFSPQTTYDEAKMTWRDVSKEYIRARHLFCSICNERGASIGCSVTTCNNSVHFPCAIKETLPDGRKNWYPCQEPTVPFFCSAKHSQDRGAHELDREIARLSDLSQGREPFPIPLEMGLAFVRRAAPVFHSVLATPEPASRQHSGGGGGGGGSGGGGSGSGGAAAVAADAAEDAASVRTQWERLLPGLPLPRGLRTKAKGIDFTYVAATVDSKTAQVRQGPERGKRCCSCTGPAACRDPRTCECLQQGRQYSNKGRLLDEAHPPQIFECNLNCRCHKEECRNRLVQRGMTCNIKVIHLTPSRHRVLEGCGKWGVKAAEEIPARSFVCTVAGQLVLASDLAGELDDEGQHGSSVLVHSVRNWTEQSHGGSQHGSSSSCGDSVEVSHGQPKLPRLAGGPQERFVDQRRYANISRYIRCAKKPEDANLVRVAVHTINQDPDAPVLALFAAVTIPAGTELLRNR